MINNFEISIGAGFSPFSKSKHNLALAKIKEIINIYLINYH